MSVIFLAKGLELGPVVWILEDELGVCGDIGCTDSGNGCWGFF